METLTWGEQEEWMEAEKSQAVKVKEFGARIELARLKAGMTRQEVAGKLGVTAATVGHWETGITNPRDNIGRIARLLVAPVEWLVNGVESSVGMPDNDTLVRVVETFGQTYRDRKQTLGRAERALYESSVLQLIGRVLPPVEAQSIIAECESELEAQRQRAAEARAARAKTPQKDQDAA